MSGDAIDAILNGMNFDPDKQELKTKMSCTVCHMGISEQHLVVRIGGRDVGPMHPKCFRCGQCNAAIGSSTYTVRNGVALCLACKGST